MSLALENRMKSINDKIRIKAIQSKVSNDRPHQQEFNLAKIKEKYIKGAHIPVLISNKQKPNSVLMVQGLLNKYKPNDIHLTKHINCINSQYHNDRYSNNEYYNNKEKNKEKRDVNPLKGRQLFIKDKQIDFFYSTMPKKEKEVKVKVNESVPLLDLTQVVNKINNDYHYESQRVINQVENLEINSSEQISFRKDQQDGSSNRKEVCPIKKKIDWLKREKRNIRNQINSYSMSPSKDYKQDKSDRDQVDNYLDEFFNYDENALQNQCKFYPHKMPNLLQRSVLKISLPNFNAIQ